MSQGDKFSNALFFLRAAAAATMFVHGAARISEGSVGELGAFLGGWGIPLGFYAAWAITLFELIGGVLLVVGVYAWIIALLFALHLSAGIFMVHWKQGWFVVGAGTGGMEFSVLLICIFAATAYAYYKAPERSFRSRR